MIIKEAESRPKLPRPTATLSESRLRLTFHNKTTLAPSVSVLADFDLPGGLSYIP